MYSYTWGCVRVLPCKSGTVFAWDSGMERNDRSKTMEERIVEYLTRHGAMSGWNIVDDLDGCTELDVQFAEMAGVIGRAEPYPGGTGAWYTV